MSEYVSDLEIVRAMLDRAGVQYDVVVDDNETTLVLRANYKGIKAYTGFEAFLVFMRASLDHIAIGES